MLSFVSQFQYRQFSFSYRGAAMESRLVCSVHVVMVKECLGKSTDRRKRDGQPSVIEEGSRAPFFVSHQEQQEPGQQ